MVVNFPTSQRSDVVAVGVGSLHISPFDLELFQQRMPLEQRGIHGCRLPGIVASIRIAFGGYQLAGYFHLAFENSPHQRGIAALITQARVSPGVQ